MNGVFQATAAQLDRATGVLLGSACGDALGAGYEFGSAVLVGRPEMIGGGLGDFAPGEWTDDTAQAVAIARVAATGASLRDVASLDQVAAGFAEWFAADPPDVGNQTRQVLSAVGVNPTSQAMAAAAEALHQRTGHTAGNGSLMRTAPVALAHLDNEGALAESARTISSLTHADPIAGEACVIWCVAIRSTVLTGVLADPRDGLHWLPSERQGFWRDRLDEAEQQQPGSFRPNGYVVPALQAAWSSIVWTAVPAEEPGRGSYAGKHLVDALETAVAIGDDTDTVAAIAGALLGARWGASAIPSGWRDLLHGWPGIRATDLTDLAMLTLFGGQPGRDGWPGTQSRGV